MNRRTFLKSTAGSPLLGLRSTAVSGEEEIVRRVATSFFDALPSGKDGKHDVVVGCASEICQRTDLITEDEIDVVIEGGNGADEIAQKAVFGAKILNERHLTDVIDESMLESMRGRVNDATRYIPILGAFNNLRIAACKVETPDPSPEAVTDFLYSSMTFGIEVALWSIGAPYQMAWKGTRFVANRSFLRFANHGCNGCIALVMSELHWAIRSSVYGHGITESKIEFVATQIDDLREDAVDLAYDVDLDIDRGEIKETLVSHGEEVVEESESILDGIMSGDWIPEIKH